MGLGLIAYFSSGRSAFLYFIVICLLQREEWGEGPDSAWAAKFPRAGAGPRLGLSIRLHPKDKTDQKRTKEMLLQLASQGPSKSSFLLSIPLQPWGSLSLSQLESDICSSFIQSLPSLQGHWTVLKTVLVPPNIPLGPQCSRPEGLMMCFTGADFTFFSSARLWINTRAFSGLPSGLLLACGWEKTHWGEKT